MNNELLIRLRTAAFVLLFKARKEQEKVELSDQLRALDSEIFSKKKEKPWVKPGIIAFFIALGLLTEMVIGCIVKNHIEGEIETGLLFGVFVFFAISAIILMLTIRSYIKQKAEIKSKLDTLLANYDEKVSKLNKDIQEIDSLVNECMEIGETRLEFLPQKYRNLHAVSFMYDAVQNMRADTLKEVINLYETELNNMKTRDQMRMAAQIQQEQMNAITHMMQEINQNQEAISNDVSQMNAIQFFNFVNNQ